MSSMRNAIQRRNHRERAQPIEREKWGILEKHKDYALRARDYKAKQKRLESLRKKAAERNPDEFHFGMSRARANDTGQKVADRGNPVLSHDAVKLLKTQDAGYLKTIGQTTRNKRERLEEEILVQEGVKGLLKRQGQQDGDGRRRRHLIFVESKEEQKNLIETLKQGSKADNDNDGRFFQFPQASPRSNKSPPRLPEMVWFEVEMPSSRADEIQITGPENGERPSPPDRQTKKSSKPKNDLPTTLKTERRLQKLRKRAQEGRLSRLKLLKKREKELLVAERELELQRAKLSNSIGGVSKAGLRWKVRERKK